MITTTIAPPAGRRRIALSALNSVQTAFAVEHVLHRLGSADGLAEDQPPVPYADRAERLALSEVAAWSLGLALTPGCEIAQCYDCTDLLDGALTEETSGVIRCDDCHTDQMAGEAPEQDTYDLWADFYRA